MKSMLMPHRIFEQAKERPTHPAYFTKEMGDWKATNWQGYADQIRRAGKAMIALRVEPGGTVCLLGFTRPEWVIFDVACMAIGGVPAGIYTTNSAEQCEYILNHAEASLLLIENEAQFHKVKKPKDRLSSLKHIITMKGAPPINDPMVISWDAFLQKGDGISDTEFESRMAAIQPHQVATLIYTSGTTGPPKGVMLSHANIAWIGSVMVELSDSDRNERTLSYLPLSHIAEQNMSIYAPATGGSPVYYAESFQNLLENLKEVQPTVFLSVPRVWEKLHAVLNAKVAETKGLRKTLLKWAMGVGARASEMRMRGKEAAGFLGLEYLLAKRLVFSKVKSAIGLGQVKMCVSGAAPIAQEVLEFLASLDVVVNEVYGLSESTGGITFNQRGKVRLGSVGTPLSSEVQVKIADDGEILANGPNIFRGYYKNEAATREALLNGWLFTGDIGKVDADGYLYILDRKKHIIITAGGKNLSPANIENEIKARDPIISHVHVHGDRRPYVTALITIHPVDAVDWAVDQGLLEDPGKAEEVKRALSENPLSRSEALGELTKKVTSHPDLRHRIAKAVNEANEKLSRVEQVKRVFLLDRDLYLEEDEITPTMKVKRKNVERNFAGVFDRLYTDESSGIVVTET